MSRAGLDNYALDREDPPARAPAGVARSLQNAIACCSVNESINCASTLARCSADFPKRFCSGDVLIVEGHGGGDAAASAPTSALQQLGESPDRRGS